jgi:hypothetical protein
LHKELATADDNRDFDGKALLKAQFPDLRVTAEVDRAKHGCFTLGEEPLAPHE